MAGRLRRLLPPDDAADAGPRLLVVGDAFEAAAQLDSSSEFAALLVGGLDCGGVGFGDEEHGWIIGAMVMRGKLAQLA